MKFSLFPTLIAIILDVLFVHNKYLSLSLLIHFILNINLVHWVKYMCRKMHQNSHCIFCILDIVVSVYFLYQNCAIIGVTSVCHLL